MDWTSKVPSFDSQFSSATLTDVDSCVAESLTHIVDMLTGKRYSPRALAKLSGTTKNGNTVPNVLATANKVGFIPYSFWPTPDSFTWDEYYAPIPANVLSQAEFYDIRLIPPNLDSSPLWTEISFGSTTHMVAQINQTQFFDSEIGGSIKPITTKIIYQSSIKLTPKVKPMTQVKQQNYKGELRVELACATIEEWNVLCKILGLDPNHYDEIVT